MTLNELIREVTLIGCDLLPNPAEQVASAANRALKIIFLEHPVTAECELYVERSDAAQVIELGDIASDVSALREPPRDALGKPLGFYEISGTRLTLSPDFSGDVHLIYERLPSKILTDYPSAAIDIPERLEPLLTLLTASQVWYEDAREIAERCERDYRELSENLKSEPLRRASSEYRHNGWA